MESYEIQSAFTFMTHLAFYFQSFSLNDRSFHPITYTNNGKRLSQLSTYTACTRIHLTVRVQYAYV